MPPQSNSQEQVGILADPEFQRLPPDVQQRVLALSRGEQAPAAPPARKWWQPGGALEDIFSPHASDIAIAGLGPILRASKRGFRAAQSPLNTFLERNQKLEDTGVLAPSATRRYPAELLKSTARFGEGMSDPINAILTAGSITPQGRLVAGGYAAATGAKSALTPRADDESVPDYLERVLYGAAGVVGGSAGIKSGGIRTPRQLLEQRLNRATYATGGTPGVNEAYRGTLADLDQSIRANKLPVRTVADVGKVVDATLDRFNTHFELAMQPYAGDTLVPTQIANDLRAAADKLPPTASVEAKYIRNYATKFERPWTLRDLQKEWVYRNKLWRGMAGKTELGQLAAKANAQTAITDVVRGSARDAVVDYLEQKYPGQGFRDLKLRQSQLLTLKDALDKQVPKLRGMQASESGKPFRAKESVSASVSEHGIIPRAHGLQRLLPGMGPERAANVSAERAFRKPGAGRAFKPLTRPTPPPSAKAAAAGVPPGPGAGTYVRPQPKPGFGTGQGVEVEGTESLKRQLGLARAGKSEAHRGWETRVMKKMEAARSRGTDTGHFQAALAEIAPGRKFEDLPPAEMSRVIQRAQQLKEGK